MPKAKTNKKAAPAAVTGTVVEDKELAVVKKNVTNAQHAAELLVVDSDIALTTASEMLTKINRVGDMIKQRKEAITKPLNEALKSARDLFRPMEDAQQAAKSVVAKKMGDYQMELARKQEAEKEKLANRVEAGTMKPETAIKKMEQMQEPVKAVQVDESASVTFRDAIETLAVVDETKIPREYLTPDMVKIRKAASIKIEIPGVAVTWTKIPVNKR